MCDGRRGEVEGAAKHQRIKAWEMTLSCKIRDRGSVKAEMKTHRHKKDPAVCHFKKKTIFYPQLPKYYSLKIYSSLVSGEMNICL